MFLNFGESQTHCSTSAAPSLSDKTKAKSSVGYLMHRPESQLSSHLALSKKVAECISRHAKLNKGNLNATADSGVLANV